MAPEQATRGSRVDERADIYSLGATFFKLLTGESPFACENGHSPLDKLRLLSEHRLRSICELRSELPPELVELIDRMLATNPTDRPNSAADIADRLTKISQDSRLKADLKSLVREAEKKTLAEATSSYSSVLPMVNSIERQANQRQAKNSVWRWGLVVAALAFLAAGILLTLELTKGQLIIESEGAEVSIKLIDEKDRTSELEIDPGTTTTRLRDGKYEITINEGSDRFSLSKDTFTIRRGEAVVARVSRREANEQGSSSDGKPFSANSSDPFGGTPAESSDAFGSDPSDSEARILAALKTQIEPDYPGIPLQQVLAALADELDIPLWINQAELDLNGIDADTPMVLQLPQVTVRSALRLMLDPLELTYVVRNEVLEITSKQSAEDKWVKVGDTLAIYVERVIPMQGEPDNPPPPIPIFQAGDRHPVQGLPFRVNSQGAVTLPLVGDVKVAGKLLAEVSRLIRQAYIDANILYENEKRKIAVSVEHLVHAGESLEVRNLTGGAAAGSKSGN
jgi:hypothetical protein